MDESQCCETCIQEISIFCSKTVNSNISSDHSRSIDPNLTKSSCQLNNFSEQDTNDNENLPNRKYRDISYFSNLHQKLKLKCFSIFHLNINLLLKSFEDFNDLINDLKLDFDILSISESRVFEYNDKI